MVKEVQCSKCDKTSCRIEIKENGSVFTVHVSMFSGEASHGISKDQFMKVKDILNKEDWESLYRINREFILGYCIDCKTNYCSDHWILYPVFEGIYYDYLKGRCPLGHTHMVED